MEEMGENSVEQVEAVEDVLKECKPAGFWIRFVALIIDSTLIYIITMPFKSGIFSLLGIKNQLVYTMQDVQTSNLLMPMIVGYTLSMVITFVYFGWFYVNKGATPGKMVLGLKVIDFDSKENLTYFQTFLREVIGKMLSALFLMIGYIMVAFRKDKRGLHDLLFSTQVVEKNE